MNDPKPAAEPPAGRRRKKRRWLRWTILAALLVAVGWAGKPVFRDVALWRARVAIDDRRHESASTWLDVAAKLRSENAEFHFLSARLHRRLGHFDRVRAHLKQAYDLGWDVKQLEREQWIAQAQTGQFAAMSRHFPELFENAGSDGPEISEAFVLIMLSRFRLDSALRVLDAWQKDFPQDAKPHLLRGRVLSVVRNWKEAQREYAEALRLSPGNEQARLQLARCLMQRLKFQEAETYLRDCLADGTDNPDVYVSLAVCLRKQQNVDDAREVLRDNWKTLSKNVEALRERGQIELAAERPQDAVPFLKAAVEAAPVDRETRYAYAQALKAAGRDAEARKELEFVNEATKPVMRLGTLMPKLIDEPANIPLRFEIAEITWKYKSRAEGAKWYHSVLQFDPNHAATHRALATHYTLAGDAERAEHHRNRSASTVSTQ